MLIYEQSQPGRRAFAQAGQVLSVTLSRDFGFVEIVSPTLREALDN